MQGANNKAAVSATGNAPPPTSSLGSSGDKKSKAQMVADILATAGEAFGKLSELVMDLTPEEELLRPSNSTSGTRWTEQEVKRLREAMLSFNNDLSKISHHVKTRTVAQVKAKMKKDSLVAAQNAADAAALASSSSNTSAAAPVPAVVAAAAAAATPVSAAAAATSATTTAAATPVSAAAATSATTTAAATPVSAAAATSATTTAAAAPGRVSHAPPAASTSLPTTSASTLHASPASSPASLPVPAAASVASFPGPSSSTVGLGTVASIGLSTSAAMTTTAPPPSLEAAAGGSLPVFPNATAAVTTMSGTSAVSHAFAATSSLATTDSGLAQASGSLAADISAAGAALSLPPIEHSLFSGILSSTAGGDVSMTSLLTDATGPMMSSAGGLNVGISAPLSDPLSGIMTDTGLSAMVTDAMTTTQTAGPFSTVAMPLTVEALLPAAVLAPTATPLSDAIAGMPLPAEMMPAISATETALTSGKGSMTSTSEMLSEDATTWLQTAIDATSQPLTSAASNVAASVAPLADAGRADLAPADAALEPPAKRARRDDSSSSNAEQAE